VGYGIGLKGGGIEMAESKVVYAREDVTLHRVQGTVSSQFGEFEVVEGFNLPAGETVALDELASYQKEAIEGGKVAGAEVVSEKEAAKRQEGVAKVRDLLSRGANTIDVRTSVALGDDGSFSDHLVSDAERVANHAARAEEEAGEAGNSDEKVTVVQSESPDAPSNAGETTRDDLDEQVQGSGGQETAVSKSKKSN
jgi:hypothetical protein